MFTDLAKGEWSSHDLRKVARTAWTDLGVDYMVGELLLNHAMKDLDATYIHTTAEGLKRQALEAWHKHLDGQGFAAIHTETLPDLEVQPWVEDELVVFCAPQHPLATLGRADIESLSQEAWILREQGSGTRLTFDQAMRHHRANLNIRLELEHTEAIKRAVESGLGIGCISRLALRDAFRRGSLVAVETPELDLMRQFYFIWHKQKYQTSAMREFLELCRSFTAGFTRSDEIVLPPIA